LEKLRQQKVVLEHMSFLEGIGCDSKLKERNNLSATEKNTFTSNESPLKQKRASARLAGMKYIKNSREFYFFLNHTAEYLFFWEPHTPNLSFLLMRIISAQRAFCKER